MKVTPHFTMREFNCKNGAEYPSYWVEPRLRPLCEMLEVIRAELGGKRIAILSGYRTPAYNKRINGAKASQHCEGRAADIVVEGMKAETVHARIVAMYGNGRLPGLGGLGLYKGFVHVDIRPGEKLARWSGSRTRAQTVVA